MAEPEMQPRDDAYRRLSDTAAALAQCAGVCGVTLVDGNGALVMRFGVEPVLDAARTLMRLVEAAAVARDLAPEAVDGVPVFLQDSCNRVYTRSVGRGLSLLVFCETCLPAGLAYRLVDEPVRTMRAALDDLFGGLPEPPARRDSDGDIFWE